MENMSRFAPLLERTNRALDLPQPQKSRIMEELAADAADLFEHLRERGIGEAEATREVETWLLTDPEQIRELEEIHRPLYLRWANRFSQRHSHRGERFALALILLGLLGVAAYLLSGTRVLSAPFGTGYAILLLGILCVVFSVERVVALWLRSGSMSGRRGGLRVVAFTTTAAPAVALLGAALAFYNSPAEADPAGEIWAAIATASGLLGAGLSVALLSSVSYLALEARIQRLERLDTVWKEE